MALYVLFGVGAVLMVGGAIALSFFLRTPEGRETWAAVQRGANWATASQQAPGAEELRGAGCTLAMVSSFGQVEDIFDRLFPGNVPDELDLGEFSEQPFVLCAADPNELPGPICPHLARVYGDAVEPRPESFFLFVQDARKSELVCQGIYGPDGTLLRAVEPAAAPEEGEA